MKKRINTLVLVVLLATSANAYAVVGGKKYPPVAASQAWYQVVSNWF